MPRRRASAISPLLKRIRLTFAFTNAPPRGCREDRTTVFDTDVAKGGSVSSEGVKKLFELFSSLFHNELVEWSDSAPNGHATQHAFRKTGLQLAYRGGLADTKIAADASICASTFPARHRKSSGWEGAVFCKFLQLKLTQADWLLQETTQPLENQGVAE